MATMDLPTAQARRAALIRRINDYIIWTAGNEMPNEDFYAIKGRMDRYKETFGTLENANAVVAGVAESNAASAALWDEFYELEDRFIGAQATMNRRFVELTPQVALIPAADVPATDGAVAAEPAKQQIVVQMPFQPQNIQQTWGKFSGNPLEWQDFRARFELGCHNRAEIPPEYKLAYLRNALTGAAAHASRGWALKAENYEMAWKDLVDKNSKRYPLACAYLSRFFSLGKLGPAATSADLQRMSNETNELVRQLRDMNYPIEHWNLIIVHALQERLNDYYAEKWDTVRNDNDEPTIEDMTKLLDYHANKTSNRNIAQSGLQMTVTNERAPQLRSVVQRPPAVTRTQQPQRYPCGACGKYEHVVFYCPEFQPLSLKERLKVVATMGMCPNCLKRGHAKEDCYDLNRCNIAACRHDNRHNSMLCPTKNRSFHAMPVSYDSSSSSSQDGTAVAIRAGYGRGRSNQLFKRPADKRQ